MREALLILERRHQHLFGKAQKHGRAGRCGDTHGGDHAIQRERADHGQPLPLTMRDLADGPPSAGEPGASPAARSQPPTVPFLSLPEMLAATVAEYAGAIWGATACPVG